MDLDEDFLVGEAPDRGIGERHFEIGRDRAGQRQVGIAGHDFHRERPRRRCQESLRPGSSRASHDCNLQRGLFC